LGKVSFRGRRLLVPTATKQTFPLSKPSERVVRIICSSCPPVLHPNSSPEERRTPRVKIREGKPLPNSAIKGPLQCLRSTHNIWPAKARAAPLTMKMYGNAATCDLISTTLQKKNLGWPATPIGQNGVAGPPQFFLFFFRLIYLFINYFYDFYYYYFVKDT
jgi:hypothetical protein